MSDQELAQILKRAWPKPPVEKIIFIDWMATATSIGSGSIRPGWHVVALECGHYAVTKAMTRTGCIICHEMILDGEDYAGFREAQAEPPQQKESKG